MTLLTILFGDWPESTVYEPDWYDL